MAATNNVKVFPRGYSGGQLLASSKFIQREGDAEVQELYMQFTHFPTQTVYWEFRKKVIDAAKRLFKGNYNWFIRQDANPLIESYNYQFLLDTVRYIATGHRRFSIHAWPMLLATEPSAGAELINGRYDIEQLFKEVQLSTDLDKMIKAWVSRPGGIDDLMYSLHLLFGTIQIVDKN